MAGRCKREQSGPNTPLQHRFDPSNRSHWNSHLNPDWRERIAALGGAPIEQCAVAVLKLSRLLDCRNGIRQSSCSLQAGGTISLGQITDDSQPPALAPPKI